MAQVFDRAGPGGALLLLSLSCAVTGCDGTSLIPDPAVRYLAFGDSSTSGRSGRPYPEIFFDLLGRPAGETVAIHGRGGETSGEGVPRLRQLISSRVYPNANVLLYWEGGGDIIAFMRQFDPLLVLSPLDTDYPLRNELVAALDRTQANIEAAIVEAQQVGMAVYVATYFPLREAVAPCEPLFLEIILPSQARNANGYVSLLNERIRGAATNTGASVVDIASADDGLRADPVHFADCNHLSERGNEVVAGLFAEALGVSP